VAAQDADPGSHLSFYRAALARRRELRDHLAREVRWLDAPTGALAFARTDARGGELQVLLNTSAPDVPVPAGELLLSSSPVTDVVLPGTAVWVKV
jgi:alpha-glucosidase